MEQSKIIDTLETYQLPTDPLEHCLLDHENDMFMNEGREFDEDSLNRNILGKTSSLLKS